MFVCTFQATLFVLAELSHVIKFKALEALYDVTVLFEQFA